MSGITEKRTLRTRGLRELRCDSDVHGSGEGVETTQLLSTWLERARKSPSAMLEKQRRPEVAKVVTLSHVGRVGSADRQPPLDIQLTKLFEHAITIDHVGKLDRAVPVWTFDVRTYALAPLEAEALAKLS